MDNVELFNTFYKNTYKGINEEIIKYNNGLLENKNGYLKENLEYFTNLNSDGKLIRGLLIALGYKIASKKDISYSFPLALAYEIFQTSVLIHDDIIDEDKLRRGKETIHYINYKNNKEYDEKLSKKIGDSIAICMGDYGFFDANKVIINNYKNDNNLAKVMNYYNDIVLKTIEGELIDVELSFDGKYKINNTDIEDNIMLVYKYKTAFYTIIGPLSLGLILGNIEDDKLKDIASFGEKIGVAFQIQDDILGIYNDMGKVIGSDIKEYKQTLLFSKTIEQDKYKDELLKYYGKENITEESIEKVREIFKSSGAFDYAFNLMNKLYDEAEEEIKSCNWIDSEDINLLLGFVEFLRNRRK
jgi:geranylgeranyl diphosphate synthase type I